MMKTEYTDKGGFLQRDSVEHEEYAEVYSAERREIKEKDGADLLEKVLDRNNLNKAYKRVKANKGASGVDGMTVEEALPWLKENGDELLMNMLREDIKDKMLIELIKRYLKSGVMENGIVVATREGSPQGGNLLPLLANIYLDKFDKEFASSRKVEKESQRQTAKTDFPKSMQKFRLHTPQVERVYEGIA